jgi:hypothetical protein
VRQTGSALGAGLRQAAALLAAGPPREGARIAILISDGEPVETEEPADVLEAARRSLGFGVRIHTIGVGTTGGGAIPDVDPRTAVTTGFKRDPVTGEVAISRRSDELLREISRTTDGHFVDGNDERAVERFLSVLRRGEGRGNPLGAGGIAGARYMWFVGLALLLLGADALLELREDRGRARRR